MKRVPCPTVLSHVIDAAVLLHDAVGDRQAEAGALADRLGREERIVDARQVLGRNAGAGVARPRRSTVRPSTRVTIDSQPPFGMASRALRNRFRNTCCSLCSMPRTTGGVGDELLAHLDAAGLELVLEQRQHVADDDVEVARRRLSTCAGRARFSRLLTIFAARNVCRSIFSSSLRASDRPGRRLRAASA